MGGSQCADFNATPLPTVDGLCRMGSGDYEGVVTYTDGRVATLAEPQAGQPAGLYIQPPAEDANRAPIALSGFSVDRMRELQGVEFGNCSATGFASSVSSVAFLPTMSGGSPISWSPEDLRALYSALGQTEGQSSNAFICSDRPNRGRIAINNDGAHMASLISAIQTFDNSCGTLDDAHCEVMLASLRTAAHEEEPTSRVWQTIEYAGGLVGVAFAFGVVVPWLQKWLGPKDGNGGGGGAGGGGGGGLQVTVVRETPPATETSAETSSSFSSEEATSNQGLWAGVAVGCFVGAAALLADDATVIGVADDPIAAVAAVAGLVFLGISSLTGEGSPSEEAPQA